MVWVLIWGQRLASYDSAKQNAYAYINLLNNEVFDEFREMLKKILDKHGIETSKWQQFNKILYGTFGIACDEICGQIPNFGITEEKCENCMSTEFDNRIAEPETLLSIDAPIITHHKWGVLEHGEKIRQIEEELVRKCFI